MLQWCLFVSSLLKFSAWHLGGLKVWVQFWDFGHKFKIDIYLAKVSVSLVCNWVICTWYQKMLGHLYLVPKLWVLLGASLKKTSFCLNSSCHVFWSLCVLVATCSHVQVTPETREAVLVRMRCEVRAPKVMMSSVCFQWKVHRSKTREAI